MFNGVENLKRKTEDKKIQTTESTTTKNSLWLHYKVKSSRELAALWIEKIKVKVNMAKLKFLLRLFNNGK